MKMSSLTWIDETATTNDGSNTINYSKQYNLLQLGSPFQRRDLATFEVVSKRGAVVRVERGWRSFKAFRAAPLTFFCPTLQSSEDRSSIFVKFYTRCS